MTNRVARAVRLPRGTVYLLLMAMLALNVVLRYPLEFDHETGSDTTFVHTLADSLIQQARALWILHVTSYLGLYALSYPSATPFLLAENSLLSGMPVEGGTFLLGLVFATFGTMSAFLVAREIRPDDRFALLVALLFSLAPFYIKNTTWIGSSRGFVTALVPVLILLVLKVAKTYRLSYTVLAIVLFVLMSTIHRMGMLGLIALAGFIIAIPLHRITTSLRFASFRRERQIRATALTVAFGCLIFLFSFPFMFPGVAGEDVITQFGQGTLFHGTSTAILILNMGVSLVGKISVLLPFLVVGVGWEAIRRPKDLSDKYLLVLLFLFVPLLAVRDYISEFLVFVLLLFVGLALYRLFLTMPSKHVKMARVVLVSLIVVAGTSSWVLKDYWRDRYRSDGPMSDSQYNAALYGRFQSDGALASNEGLFAGRLAAISGLPVFPLGGASLHWYGAQQLTWGLVNGSDLQVQPVYIADITFGTDWIFEPTNVKNAEAQWESIFYNSVNDPQVQHTMSSLHIRYVTLDNRHLNEFNAYIWRPSPFDVSVQQECYKVYESGDYSSWFVG